MTSLAIEERLRHYFMAMGAQPTEPTENAPGGLTVNLGSERIHVAVLNNEALHQRGRIIESIIDLFSTRDPANQFYLAAPRLLGTTLDTEIFRSHGIGLLLFDDRRIDETVAPQPHQMRQSENSDHVHESELASEVASLRSVYAEMQSTLARLHDDLRTLREDIGSAQPTPQRIDHPLVSPQVLQVSSSGLPSFFNNNPWLDVLSKRGREEPAQIAG